MTSIARELGRPVDMSEVTDIVEKCFADERVDACRVSIMKLDIFNETEAAGVEVYRTRAAWA